MRVEQGELEHECEAILPISGLRAKTAARAGTLPDALALQAGSAGARMHAAVPRSIDDKFARQSARVEPTTTENAHAHDSVDPGEKSASTTCCQEKSRNATGV